MITALPGLFYSFNRAYYCYYFIYLLFRLFGLFIKSGENDTALHLIGIRIYSDCNIIPKDYSLSDQRIALWTPKKVIQGGHFVLTHIVPYGHYYSLHS